MSTEVSMAPLARALNRVSAAPIARIVTSRPGSIPLPPSALRSKISSMVPSPETATFLPRRALTLENSAFAKSECCGFSNWQNKNLNGAPRRGGGSRPGRRHKRNFDIPADKRQIRRRRAHRDQFHVQTFGRVIAVHLRGQKR